VGAEVVRGGNGGGAFSSSLSLPVAISKLSNSLKVYLEKVNSSEVSIQHSIAFGIWGNSSFDEN
jgi:hypothetical protein